MRERAIHPAAQLFPAMTGEELEALTLDILAVGLRESIVLHSDGTILDGRHRYLACKDLGLEPRTVLWDGRGSPEEYVISRNLHRRHMNESQRGMVAAKIATRRREDSLSQNLGPDGYIQPSGKTAQEAGVLLNVGKATVKCAKTVLAAGTPEEIAAVEQGRLPVSTAARAIRARRAPEKSQGEEKNGNAGRFAEQRLRATQWRSLKTALTELTSLPQPADVVMTVRRNDRTNLVNTKLANALAWLEGFSDAWSRYTDEKAP